MPFGIHEETEEQRHWIAACDHTAGKWRDLE